MIRVFVSSVSVGLETIRAQIIVDLQTANFDIGAGHLRLHHVSSEVGIFYST